MVGCNARRGYTVVCSGLPSASATVSETPVTVCFLRERSLLILRLKVSKSGIGWRAAPDRELGTLLRRQQAGGSNPSLLPPQCAAAGSHNLPPWQGPLPRAAPLPSYCGARAPPAGRLGRCRWASVPASARVLCRCFNAASESQQFPPFP